MASKVATAALVDSMGGALNLASATVKAMLLKNTYTPNADHKVVSDINSHECSVSGYTGGFGGAGRKTVGSKTVTENTGTDRAVFDCADPATWVTLGAGNTLGYIAFIVEITNDAASRVVAVCDLGGDKITNGGDFTVAIDALGVLYVQC